MNEKWTEALVKLNACPEAVRWASKYPSLQAAWDVCKRSDWMWWLLGLNSVKTPLSQMMLDCKDVAEKHQVTFYLIFRPNDTGYSDVQVKLSAQYADIIRKHCPKAPKLQEVKQ